ncbi:hypothetical protein [Rudanella lutea]|uniref:hypothetical protein n=1 Tax=Rudanella lutea TaxID=451374 RepID=UPI00036557A4|nr:hypothetical protein [Rudanella lutea]
MNVFLLKITLMPSIIALVTLVARRWGNRIGGLIGSMPWIAGPILFFFILEQGKAFGVQSIEGVLIGVLSLLGFCYTYTALSKRLPWFPTLLGAYVPYAATVLLFSYLRPGLWPCYLLILGGVFVTLRYFPKPTTEPVKPRRLPFEIPIRMVVATVFVVLITHLAEVLGPTWSGILTPFPIMTSILAIFSHTLQGSNAAIHTLRGLVIGLFGFSTFLFLQAFLLPHFSVAVSFGLALVVNAVINMVANRVW